MFVYGLKQQMEKLQGAFIIGIHHRLFGRWSENN